MRPRQGQWQPSRRQPLGCASQGTGGPRGRAGLTRASASATRHPCRPVALHLDVTLMKCEDVIGLEGAKASPIPFPSPVPPVGKDTGHTLP